MREKKLRLHKPSGQGFIQIQGRRYYLGPYGDPQTVTKFHRLMAELAARGGKLQPKKTSTIGDLIDAYLDHANRHYVDAAGNRTTQLHLIASSLGAFRELYGQERIAKLEPICIRAVQQRLIERRLSRSTINHYAAIIKSAIKWGVSEGIVPAGVYAAIAATPGLRAGRTEARETDDVRPVPTEHIEAVRAVCSGIVRDLIDLQLLTGARPGEVVGLRAVDIDMSGAIWTAKIKRHKNAWRGQSRELYFGPRAQEIIKRRLTSAVGAPLFAFDGGKSAYTTRSYRQAINRACAKAKVPEWNPNQLRHNAATELRKQYGTEAAQLLLGHAKLDTTQIYAERDRSRALEIAAERG